jgi:hypothetical protein
MSLTLDGSNSVTINSGAILGITSGTAVASTSGTSIDFTSIPSWVKRVTVMFNGVSTSAGTGDLLIQIGSGSVTTTGYLSGNILINNTTPSTSNFTSGIAKLPTGGATANMTGILFLTNLSGNLWVASATAMSTSTLIGGSTTGSISLGGVLDRVRITTTNGTDTFDAGSINILYE